MFVRVLCLLVFAPMLLHAATTIEREQTLQRISPVGDVYVREQQALPLNRAGALPQVENQADTESLGQLTYEQHCVVCHQDGVAGAPIFRGIDDWKKRVATKTLDLLTASAIKGLNAMPAKGTCQECTEAEIKAAIEYMVPK